MDQYFVVQHSYQVGVLRYDNVCSTLHVLIDYIVDYIISFSPRVL